MRVSSDGSGWMALKHQAKRLYEAGHYQQALEAFQAALAAAPSSAVPAAERQVLLSNAVACRLRLGGEEHARAAIQDAQECIRCNDQWAKGHLRLAEAYIALGGHSNQACNSLQTALRLDPGLSSARQLLLRELRRDHRHASSSARTTTAPAPSSSSSFSTAASDSPTPAAAHDLDDVESASPPWGWERLCQCHTEALQWYRRQSEWKQGVVRLAGIFLVLYVAFGGRFGLEYLAGSSASHNQGNYGPGNAYEQYRRQRREQAQSSSYNYHGYGSSHPYHGDGYHRADAGGSFGWGNGSWSTGSSYSMGFFDPTSLLLLVGAAVLCHQAGINPLHALVILHRLGRRNQNRHYGGIGMGWMGGGGLGYRRPRGWYFR